MAVIVKYGEVPDGPKIPDNIPPVVLGIVQVVGSVSASCRDKQPSWPPRVAWPCESVALDRLHLVHFTLSIPVDVDTVCIFAMNT